VPDTFLLSESLALQYGQAFYWAIAATTSGGKIILPYTFTETTFTILTKIFGLLVYAFIIGSATTALSMLDLAGQERRHKLEVITSFLHARSVPHELQKKIIDFYEYLHSRHDAGVSGAAFGGLHTMLRHELVFEINREMIQKVPMFNDINTECILALIENLKSRVYLPKEVVCAAGERGEEMYFIVRGRFEVLVPVKSQIVSFGCTANHLVVAELKDGKFFGEQALLEDTLRNATIRSSVHGELMILTKGR
jgi:voltage-gated potassium channel